MDQCSPWQPEFFELTEEEQPFLGLLQKGRGIELPLKVMGDDQAEGKGVKGEEEGTRPRSCYGYSW